MTIIVKLTEQDSTAFRDNKSTETLRKINVILSQYEAKLMHENDQFFYVMMSEKVGQYKHELTTRLKNLTGTLDVHVQPKTAA